MTDDELKALVASLAQGQKEVAIAQKQTEELIKQTTAQMKQTDEKLERIGITVGNMSNNQGDVAEEFFFNSLINDCHIGDMYFDEIIKNMEKHRGKKQEEYDLLLVNGNTAAIIEVKYKAHSNDLKKLDRKIQNFKPLFPDYKDYKVYGGLASFHFNDNAKEETLNRGYFVLQRSGNIISSSTGDHLKAF